MTYVVHSVSVIICAYTEARWNDLVAAVESVKCQSVPATEIIVVIDHNPALLHRVQSTMQGVFAVENSEPRGLSGARNSGVAVARGAIIAFLDDDAIAAPDWLAQMLTCYDDPNVLGVGGKIVPLWQDARPGWFPEEFDWVVGCTYRGHTEVIAPVRNLIGANMSFRGEVFAEVGGFSNGIGRVGTLPVGCEETELCIRVRQRWPHATLRYLPSMRVSHLVPAGRATWRYFRSRCYAEGISKALVSQLVGTSDGLSSERTYTVKTLPLGVIRGLAAMLRGELRGVGRAGAIVAGLGITTVGYITGQLEQFAHQPQIRHIVQETG